MKSARLGKKKVNEKEKRAGKSVGFVWKIRYLKCDVVGEGFFLSQCQWWIHAVIKERRRNKKGKEVLDHRFGLKGF